MFEQENHDHDHESTFLNRSRCTNDRSQCQARYRPSFPRCNCRTIRPLLTDDAQWTLPGDNTISGTASGADAVVDRVRKIAGYGMNFGLLYILVSRDNVALSLYNTAQGGDRVFDEYLATVCRLKDGKIAFFI